MGVDVSCEHVELTDRIFFIYCYADHRGLHSFPTRRSSDLGTATITATSEGKSGTSSVTVTNVPVTDERSEEHTSELQSPDQLVCRLLLEKKNSKSDYKARVSVLCHHAPVYLSFMIRCYVDC